MAAVVGEYSSNRSAWTPASAGGPACQRRRHPGAAAVKSGAWRSGPPWWGRPPWRRWAGWGEVCAGCAGRQERQRGQRLPHRRHCAGAVDASLVGLAVISVLWAGDGFAVITLASGEVTNPQRNPPALERDGHARPSPRHIWPSRRLPHVSPIGAGAPPGGGRPLIAADTMSGAGRPVGSSCISAVVMLPTFGALMAGMLASPRVCLVEADDKLFFPTVARVQPATARRTWPSASSACSAPLFGLTSLRAAGRNAFHLVLSIGPFSTLASPGCIRCGARIRTSAALSRRRRSDHPAMFIVAGVGLIANAMGPSRADESHARGVALAGAPVYWAFFR